MTKVFDISLQVMKHVTDVLEGTATDGSATYLKDVDNLIQANEYYDRGTLWIRSGTHANKSMRVNGHANNKLTFNPLSSVLCVQQVETATVAGTVTGNGNATVVITAPNMPNSPKTISVAVVNADTASQVATKIRTALNADTDVKNFFTIGGSGADITLTTKTARANDSTMNMSVDNGTCTGLTAAPTSANTTAGVAGPRYAVARHYPFEQVVAKIESALDETYVTGEDSSLTGDGEALEFILPAGVYDILRVEIERENYPQFKSNHWHEHHGSLRFDYGHAPFEDDVLHIFYKTPHAALSTYSDEISTEINREWLVLTAARELLFWGASMYGIKNHMIEDRLNKVLGMLKGKVARIGGPNVIMKSGGSSDYSSNTR